MLLEHTVSAHSCSALWELWRNPRLVGCFSQRHTWRCCAPPLGVLSVMQRDSCSREKFCLMGRLAFRSDSEGEVQASFSVYLVLQSSYHRWAPWTPWSSLDSMGSDSHSSAFSSPGCVSKDRHRVTLLAVLFSGSFMLTSASLMRHPSLALRCL